MTNSSANPSNVPTTQLDTVRGGLGASYPDNRLLEGGGWEHFKDFLEGSIKAGKSLRR